MAEVIFRKVGKAYEKDRWVVRDFSAAVSDGQFCVLLGPSGCGKTTLLRMIAGLESITKGEILIDGQVINMLAPKDRDLAMVFQNYALYPHKTVYQNIEFPLKLRKVPAAARRQKVQAVAGVLAIEELLERYPRQLSGGQKQRVAVGRALVRQPKVYLFDEPLSNLDARLRSAMRSELKLMHRRFGTTFVYVTHDQVEAMTLADQIVLLNQGRIQQSGTPEDLYHHPQNIFTGAFIGNPPMNFALPDRQRRMGSFTLETSSDKRLAVGIRPEKLSLDRSNWPCSFQASVLLEETVGKEYHYHLKPQGFDALEDRFVLVASHRFSAGSRKTVKVYFHPGSLMLFDAETGQRIGEAIA